MDQQLKQLMKELGEAINESLSDSESIAEVVARIKEGGYDLFLVLEATIGARNLDYARILSAYAHWLRKAGRKAEAKSMESRARTIAASAADQNPALRERP